MPEFEKIFTIPIGLQLTAEGSSEEYVTEALVAKYWANNPQGIYAIASYIGIRSLWTWNDKVFHVVELNANQKMVGIITEIFFYANYMGDLLLTDGFTINKKYHEDEKKNRGYDHIVSGKYNRINGIMLADIYHPIVCEEILELMNESELRDENGDHIIKYFRTEYEWEAVSVRRKQK